MSDKRERPCQAKNPNTCRVHGPGLLVPVVLERIMDNYFGANAKNKPSGQEFMKQYMGDYDPELAEQFVAEIFDEIQNTSPEKTNHYSILRAVQKNHEYKEVSPYNSVGFLQTALETVEQERNLNTPLPDDGTNELLIPMNSKEGYKYLIANVVASHGSPVSKGNNTYGWHDSKASSHVSSCGIGYVTDAQEETWSEWAGTFAEHDNYVQGITGMAACNCGRWRGTLRWEGSPSEAIRLAFSRLGDLEK